MWTASLEGAITSVVGEDNAPWDNRTQKHHTDRSSRHSKLRDFIIKEKISCNHLCHISRELLSFRRALQCGKLTLGPREKKGQIWNVLPQRWSGSTSFSDTQGFFFLLPLYIHTQDKNTGCQVQSLQYSTAIFLWNKMYLARFINQLLKSGMQVPVDLRRHQPHGDISEPHWVCSSQGELRAAPGWAQNSLCIRQNNNKKRQVDACTDPAFFIVPLLNDCTICGNTWEQNCKMKGGYFSWLSVGQATRCVG